MPTLVVAMTTFDGFGIANFKQPRPRTPATRIAPG